MSPLSPGRAESHGFEYKRNGTLSLFAALNVATGEVLGKTTSAQFVAFLTEVVSTQRAGQQIHVICDNVSSHKTIVTPTLIACGAPPQASNVPDSSGEGRYRAPS